jgi:hypothetical protein
MRPEAIVRSFFFGGFLITQGRGQPGYNIPWRPASSRGYGSHAFPSGQVIHAARP